MLFNLYQSLSLPLETWCASPKGCYKSTDPVTGEETLTNGVSQAPALPGSTEETNPLQDIIDNSINHLVNASMGKLLEVLLWIVIAIVVLAVIKKLMVAGVAKAKSLDIGSQVSNAGKNYAAQKEKEYADKVRTIAEAKKLRLQAIKTISNDEEYGKAYNALEEVLENGKSFYEREISKQDSIQGSLEESLGKQTTKMKSVDLGADDLSLKSLRSYDMQTREMFTTRNPDTLFAEYNDIDPLMDMDMSYIDHIPSIDMGGLPGSPNGIPSSQEAIRVAKQAVQKQKNQILDSNGEALPLPPNYRQ